MISKWKLVVVEASVSDVSLLAVHQQEGVDSDQDGEYSDSDTIEYDSGDCQGEIFSESESRFYTGENEPLKRQQLSRKKRKQTQVPFYI